MQRNNRTRRLALRARGFAGLCAVLGLAVGIGARPAAAAPFAYVANNGDNTVLVIDTANPTATPVTIPVGNGPVAVAATPDGTHVYVANQGSNTVSVIDIASNTVAATVPVGTGPVGVAVNPDGAHVYVANSGSNNVSVIDTASNAVVTTIGVGTNPVGIAVTPDGFGVYVANEGSGTVSVIATVFNAAVAAIPAAVTIGRFPFFPVTVAVTPDGAHVYVGLFGPVGGPLGAVITTASYTLMFNGSLLGGPTAFTPDGTHGYVTVSASGTVAVIDTASNTVTTTVPVGTSPVGVAVTPDGKFVYVANRGSNNVSVIATDSNTVTALVSVGKGPVGVAIASPPQGVPFAAFKTELIIQFGKSANTDAFLLFSEFILGHNSNGINPPAEPVTLTVGTFTTTIPPGSFKGSGFGPFFFFGAVNGVDLGILILPTGAKRFAFDVAAEQASLTGTTNPVLVNLAIGDDTGIVPVNALIFH